MIGTERICSRFPGSMKSSLALLAMLPAVLLSGALIGIRPQAFLWLLGLFGILGYLLLAYVRDFVAFICLVLFALTVWLSSIKIIGGVSVMVGLGLIFMGVWLSRLVLGGVALVKAKEYRLLLGMAAVVVISALYHLDGPAGLAPILTYIQLFVLFALVVNLTTSPSRLHNLGGAIIASSTLLAVVVLLDRFELLPAGLIHDQITGMDTGSGLEMITRSGGLWGDANFTAVQLTVALPFVIEWWPVVHNWRKRWLLVIATGLILTAFAFTFSIGGLIGLSVILLTKAVRDSRRSVRVAIVRIGLLAIAVFGILLTLPNLYVQRVMLKLNIVVEALSTMNRDLLLTMGTNRGDTWQAAVQAVGHSPLLGYGPGNAAYASVRYSVIYGGKGLIAAHNMFLTLTTDLGVIGLALFLGLLVSAILAVKSLPYLQISDSVLNRDGRALFIALLAYTVQGFAIDIHCQKILWVLLGMAIAHRLLCLSAPSNHHDPMVAS